MPKRKRPQKHAKVSRNRERTYLFSFEMTELIGLDIEEDSRRVELGIQASSFEDACSKLKVQLRNTRHLQAFDRFRVCIGNGGWEWLNTTGSPVVLNYRDILEKISFTRLGF